jgi:hypothetical protein
VDSSTPAVNNRRSGLPPAVVYPLSTPDRFRILLTRYKGGSKGPVMLVHGVSVASSMFRLATIDENFVQYLTNEGYDVWLLDWRASIHLPLRQFTLDEAALNDFPCAIDHILKTAHATTIQAVVHCVGSIAFFMSMSDGHLQGKVRCVAVSQVALHPHVGAIMQAKSRFGLAMNLRRLGMEEVSPVPDPMYPIFSGLLRGYVNSVHHECRSTVCHRLTFMFGHVYAHKNLNVETHDDLANQFGPCNLVTLEHLEQAARLGYVAHFDYGLEENLEKYGTEKPPSYVADAKYFKDVKIKLVSGRDNRVFDRVSTEATFQWLKRNNPAGDYKHQVIPDYGHWDNFAGYKANHDVYRAYLELLEGCADKGAVPQEASTAQ